MKKILIIISLFIVIALLIIFIPNLSNNYTKTGKLFISEIMPKNDNTILDDYNEYSDYIEIYNGYDYDINLQNYYLSDSEFEFNKWQFPDITIKAHEYLIVFASSKDTCNLNKRICHTNFNLSSNGEILTLFDKNGNIISKIKYPNLNSDEAYGYNNGKYIVATPSPGEKNNDKEVVVEKQSYNLKINEYMTHNKIHYDTYGNYYDWVEIYNDSDKEVNLNNIYISDDKNNLTKFKLPNISVKSYDYLIIYFGNTNYTNGIYADFGLSNNDLNIVISDGNNIIDIVDMVKLEDNISYGKTNDGWRYFTSPTPGGINNTASFIKIGGSYGNS